MNRILPQNKKIILKSIRIETPLGVMLAIADEEDLYFLEFHDWCGLEREVEILQQELQCDIVSGYTRPLREVEEALSLYFGGKLNQFTTKTNLFGTPFQFDVWSNLCKISYGQTKSYAEIARAIGKPKAYRAVAQACGANRIAIIIPCHRVISTDGSLGGYGGGAARKEWLLQHER